MTTGLIWAITLGVVMTIWLFVLIPLWITIRFPDRAAHHPLPPYLRRADTPALPMQREAPERGAAPVRTAA